MRTAIQIPSSALQRVQCALENVAVMVESLVLHLRSHMQTPPPCCNHIFTYSCTGAKSGTLSLLRCNEGCHVTIDEILLQPVMYP